MNQENEIVDVDDNEQESNTEEASVETGRGPSKKIALFGVTGILFAALMGAGVWYLFFKAPAGKPVAAPRDTSFGKNSGSKIPEGARKITLSKEQVDAANFKIVEVGETLAGAASESATTGVVKANEYRETPVISQVSGVLKRTDADLGKFVRQGETIAVVASEELANTQSEFLSRKAELEESQKRYRRALDLSEISEESRNELDEVTAKLKTAEAESLEAKLNLERSAKLSAIGAISKRELEQARTVHEAAKAKQTEAASRFERAKRLLKINPARKNEIDNYLTMVRSKQSEVSAVRAKLLVLGLSSQRINSLNSPSQINPDLPIVSPVSGTVTDRIANRGEVVSSNGKLASVTDLSTIWVIAQVYEKDLGKLRVGSGAGITTDSYPGRYFRGNVSYIDPQLDASTRTAQVRIELPNPDQQLKLGMYVRVAFATLGGSEKTTPLIPEEALQFLGNEQVVFEATEDPLTFLVRPVAVMEKIEKAYPASRGIFVGDKIVADGSFLLRAEWLKTNGE